MLTRQQFSVCFLMAALWHGLAATTAVADPADDARTILDTSGVRGGLVVHLGCADGKLTAALRANNSYQVHGLTREAAQVQTARANIRKLGTYGDVAVDRLDGNRLPYIDNLVNLLVIEDQGDVPKDEVLRVLVPNGVALTKGADGTWTKTVKPRPDSLDDWSHYLHDASGNAVAHDDVVGPPQHLQWVGNPRWSRHHDRMASMSAMTSTGGRLFYIMDEGSRISIQMPSKWKLIARDAFNGTILWKRDIPTWQNHLWPLKSGPTQLSRRLVSTDDEVYVTFGLEAPLTAVDAATGEALREYADTSATEEFIKEGETLFLVVNKAAHELKDFTPLHNTGDQGRVAGEFLWNEEPRVVMAFESETGKQLWAKATRIAPLTLSADAGRAYFHDGERLHALDRMSGEPAWSSEPVSRRQAVTFNFGPRLVIYQDVVLFAGGDGKVTGFESATGEELWSSEHPNSGYQSPQDLMVIDGLVWFAGTTQGNQDGVFKGRDPRTGEVKKEFPPDINTYWFHHRCYIAKATDNFIIPSRTGIEFVDIDAEHWDINHWVRGGCLYGVMPCNGMVYAPPHDCACYPEAKLFGINALAPAAPTRPVPREVPDEGRLEQGPAWRTELTITSDEQADEEWQTYRHDTERSGYRAKPLPTEVTETWSVKLGGRLTPPVIAGGRTYIAQVDAHTLHTFNAQSGEADWTFTAGGRIDSPPTVNQGRVVFGCADGWVYCLRDSDGAIVWRFRAAPEDRRHTAYEQLESVWPVHGSVLVRENTVYCVAGRSIFLDGGLRLLRLDLVTGKKLSETLLDERNPETGNDLQEVLQTLQMPVGLPDILSSDGQFVYMRSQKFDFEGNRLDVGPHSGNAVVQGGTQRGEGVHLFAPTGFLDESWFHRSYWVWGRSFAGGHNGYYQAGRFTPSGQILVTGAGYVYGYGRKPQYYKWTTTMERQLFAAGTDPPTVELEKLAAPAGGAGNSQIGFDNSASLNPANKPLTVEAWINANRPAGVIVARGGPAEGFALTLQQGKPQFLVRSESKLGTVAGPRRIVGEWHHVAGVLTADKQMRLYVDGQLVASGAAPGLISKDPAQPMEIGADNGSAVGEYQSPQGFTGLIDDVRLYMAALDDAAIKGRYDNPSGAAEAEPVLWVDFDEADARDRSQYRNNGTIVGAEPFDGRFGRAMKFAGGNNRRAGNAGQSGNSFVENKWAQDLPIYVRAMVLADRTLYLVGPADIIDEEETFKRITEGDETVKPLLSEQDVALDGGKGSQLLIVDADTGETKGKLDLPSVPVWDGLAAAHGRLYLTTADGRLICIAKP